MTKIAQTRNAGPSRNGTTWRTLNKLLKKRGIFYGFPIGIFQAEIVTSSKFLRELVRDLGHENALRYQQEVVQDKLDAVLGDLDVDLVNEWRTHVPWKGSHGTVYVLRERGTGKAFKMFLPENRDAVRLTMWINTGAMRTAYNLSGAERKARRRLEEALSESQRHCYTVNDAFVEHGKSGLLYLLRKGRPTIAMRQDEKGVGYPLCALCLHPLGYYSETWAGIMPPSDEVFAHLLMIRANEHLFWRKANQIPFNDPRSGV